MSGKIVLQDCSVTYETLWKCIEFIKEKLRFVIKENDYFGLCVGDNFVYLLYFLAIVSENKNVYMLHPSAAENTLKRIGKDVILISDRKQLFQYENECLEAISRADAIAQANSREDIVFGNAEKVIVETIRRSMSSLIFSTSGTATGVSKLVEVDLSWLYIKSLAIAEHFNINKVQSCVIFSPVCFIQVLWTILSHIFVGVTLYFADFSISGVVNLIKDKKIYTIVTTASIMRGIITYLQRENSNIDSVRRIICGGDYVSYPLLKSMKEYFPLADYGNVYGCSELSAASIVAGPVRLADVDEDVGIGIPFLDSEIRLSEGDFGEIMCKTKYTKMRYLEEDQLFVDENGFFATGDWARRDKNGIIYFVSRKKSIINYNGQKINPHEVEDLLNLCDGIDECVVVKELGLDTEVAICYIKACMPISRDGLVEYLLKYLESYKIPRRFYLVEALPKTVSGKIIRNNSAYLNITKMELV